MKNNFLPIIVISGPSGSGKTSLTRKIVENNPMYYLSISTTTRQPREGEIDGIDYRFISHSQFTEEINNGDFLEWAEVHGNFYGTSLKSVNQARDEGKIVIFDIDVQGHRALKKIFGHFITSIFVTTSSMEILKQRLENRGTDSDDVIQKRLINAYDEMEAIQEYGFLLINDVFNDSYEILKSLIIASHYKIDTPRLETFRYQWKNEYKG